MKHQKGFAAVALLSVVFLAAFLVSSVVIINQFKKSFDNRSKAYVSVSGKQDVCGAIDVEVQDSGCPKLSNNTGTNNLKSHSALYTITNKTPYAGFIKYKTQSWYCLEPYGQSQGPDAPNPSCVSACTGYNLSQSACNNACLGISQCVSECTKAGGDYPSCQSTCTNLINSYPPIKAPQLCLSSLREEIKTVRIEGYQSINVSIIRSADTQQACGSYQTDFFILEITTLDNQVICSPNKLISWSLCQTGLTCVSPTPTPTPMPPTPTPTPAPPTPTPTPAPSCGSVCAVDSNCPTGLKCINWTCKNPNCTTSNSCVCPTPTPTPIPTPTPTPISNVCVVTFDYYETPVCWKNTQRIAVRAQVKSLPNNPPYDLVFKWTSNGLTKDVAFFSNIQAGQSYTAYADWPGITLGVSKDTHMGAEILKNGNGVSPACNSGVDIYYHTAAGCPSPLPSTNSNGQASVNWTGSSVQLSWSWMPPTSSMIQSKSFLGKGVRVYRWAGNNITSPKSAANITDLAWNTTSLAQTLPTSGYYTYQVCAISINNPTNLFCSPAMVVLGSSTGSVTTPIHIGTNLSSVL